MAGVRRAELLVAAANPRLAGLTGPRGPRRGARLRAERHVWIGAGGRQEDDLVAVLGGLAAAGVTRLRVAADGSDDGIALTHGGGPARAWRPEAAFDEGGRRWTVAWREGPAGELAPVPDDLDAAEAELTEALEDAVAAAPAEAREHRVLLTARATLRGEASPTASPIRRLRAALRPGAPETPAAAAIAGGELPAAYPPRARRLFRAAVEAELARPAVVAARGAALNAL